MQWQLLTERAVNAVTNASCMFS